MLAGIARLLKSRMEEADEREEALRNYPWVKMRSQNLEVSLDRSLVTIRKLRMDQEELREKQAAQLVELKAILKQRHAQTEFYKNGLDDMSKRINALYDQKENYKANMHNLLGQVVALQEENKKLKAQLDEPDELRKEYDDIVQAEETAAEAYDGIVESGDTKNKE